MDTSQAVGERPVVFLADPEHGTLRLAIFALFLAVWVAGYAVMNAIIPNDGFNVIAGLAGFGVAALLISRVIEPYLQRRWPSGRTLELDTDSVRLIKRGQTQKTIHSREPISILLWNFKIRHRRNRVPAGWFVMACALEQDEEFLPVYALVSPEQAKSLGEFAHFTTLISDKDAKVKDVRQDTLRVTGEQRRLRLAETFRWTDGAELTFADFEQFLRQINARFPLWMPLPQR